MLNLMDTVGWKIYFWKENRYIVMDFVVVLSAYFLMPE